MKYETKDVKALPETLRDATATYRKIINEFMSSTVKFREIIIPKRNIVTVRQALQKLIDENKYPIYAKRIGKQVFLKKKK